MFNTIIDISRTPIRLKFDKKPYLSIRLMVAVSDYFGWFFIIIVIFTHKYKRRRTCRIPYIFQQSGTFGTYLFTRLIIPYKRKSNNVYDILVSSGLDRGPFIFFLARQCRPWARKITSWSDRLRARVSRSRRYGILTMNIIYSILMFTLYARVTRSRTDGMPVDGRYSIHA